jgi:hypothetical protein
MEVSSQLHDPAALPPEKKPLVPIVPSANIDAVVKRKIPSPYQDSNLRSFSPSVALILLPAKLTLRYTVRVCNPAIVTGAHSIIQEV